MQILPTRSEHAAAVHQAATRADIMRAITDVYDALQNAIDTRKPVCVASGKCCKFDEYGHRLYVTTLELAAFVAGMKTAASDSCETTRNLGVSLTSRILSGREPAKSADCPYQIDGLCSVHSIRPFGCRVFFCDPTSTTWQQDLYESTLVRLKREHERLGVPYFYVEWRAALREVGLKQTQQKQD